MALSKREVDILVDRARATTVEALPEFLGAQSARTLRTIYERLTGESVYLSRSRAAKKIAQRIADDRVAGERLAWREGT